MAALSWERPVIYAGAWWGGPWANPGSPEVGERGVSMVGKSGLLKGALAILAALGSSGVPSRSAARASGDLVAAPPPLQFRVLARTGMPLGDVVWAGSRFVYALEGRSQLYSSGADGSGFWPFTQLPRNGGEMRCALSPGTHGWPESALFCHAAEGPIYRLPAGGGPVSLFATIPSPRPSDGALTFDTVGRFGYALLAATGGSDSGPGGDLYAVRPGGAVRHVGSYGGPGGAEQIALAPPGFGTAGGQALLTIDKHDHLGRLLAMDTGGRVRTLATGLAWGLNPIAPLVPGKATTGAVPGLYVVDWLSHEILFVAAAQLRPYLVDVLVSTERHGYLYTIQPAGSGYRTIPIRTNLRAHDYNFEAAKFLAG